MRLRALPVVAAALALAACGQQTATSPTSPTTAGSGATTPGASGSTDAGTAAPGGTTSSTSPGNAPLVVQGAWIKATKKDMTGVFGTLKNTSDKPVKVMTATSDAAKQTQLHITTKDASGAMVMKETKAGFTIPAGGSFELKPGSNHIMLMKIGKPILSGLQYPITLKLADGKTVTFEARAREYNGAKETYAPTATVSADPSMTPMSPSH